MPALPLFALVLYGISLAIGGDPLLLIISTGTVLIWLLPSLVRGREVVSAPETQTYWPEPEPGTLVTVQGDPFLFQSIVDQVFNVEIDADDLNDFFKSLSFSLNEEVWILSSEALLGAECMRQFSALDDVESLERFKEELLARVAIRFPINLFFINRSDDSANHGHWLAGLSAEENLRLFYSAELRIPKSLSLRVRRVRGVFLVSITQDGRNVEFLMANSAQSNQIYPVNDMTTRLSNLGHGN